MKNMSRPYAQCVEAPALNQAALRGCAQKKSAPSNSLVATPLVCILGRNRKEFMQIAKNKVVSIDYKLMDKSGRVLDSSEDGNPLAYIHGAGNLIPGLETALDGKRAGDKISVTIAPKDAYGERDEGQTAVIPRDRFNVKDLKAGMRFQAQTSMGTRIITVISVDADNVKVDGNHPLAGVTLVFDVTVKEVRDATQEELAHGHVHGPGGHHH
jgi:FKBP-type peptidyl-prolyl cis-trans isomerase SlyD